MAHVRTRKIIEPSRLAGQGLGLNAHWRVAKTAVAIANEVFGPYMAANNEYYKHMRPKFRNEREFREFFSLKCAPLFLEKARKVLTDLLSSPDDELPQREKDGIFEALILDNDLRANRKRDTDDIISPALFH